MSASLDYRRMRFGDIAVALGYVTGAELSSALTSASQSRGPSTGEVLIARRLLTPTQVRAILAHQGKEILVCTDPQCGQRYNVSEHDPRRAYRCPKCQGRLALLAFAAAPRVDRELALRPADTPNQAGSGAIERGVATPAPGPEARTAMARPPGHERGLELAALGRAPSSDTVRLQAPPSAAAATRGLARYWDACEINRGGMGTILRAVDPDAGREVAIKVLNDDVRASPEHVRKFLLEARVTAQLEHPNIVPIHEVASDDGSDPYIAMKLVRGRSLAEVLRSIRDEGATDWPLARLLLVFGKVCDGVAFAHSKGVIHRDLKPDNVMVGEFGEVLVMDWGLAKVMSARLPQAYAEPATSVPPRSSSLAAHESERTLDGMILGTPAYMPPEQADGRGDDVGVQSDVYTLGAILYEILTLSPPHHGTSAFAIIEQSASGQVEPPHLRAPDRHVPRELEAVAMVALAHDPSDRYPDVRSLGEEIGRFLDGRALEAAHYTASELVAKWLRRHRGPVVSAAAVLCLALATGLALHARRETHRRAQIADALDEAVAAVAGLPSSDTLAAEIAKFQAAGYETQHALLARQSTHHEAVVHHLAAVAALDRALFNDSRDAGLVARRRDAGEALGLAAVLSGEQALARRAFTDLARWGAPEAHVEARLALAQRMADWLAEWRNERLREMVADLRRGLAASNRRFADWGFEDYVFEAAGYRDEGTVAVVGGALLELANRDTPLSAHDEPLASFCCTVLGRIGVAGAVAPLATWADAARTDAQRVEVGLALCNTRRAEAYASVARLRGRLGSNSPGWLQVARAFGRLPEPANVATDQLGTAESLARRGALRGDQGDIDGALSDLSRAIELSPKPAYYVQRGLMHRERGECSLAIDDYDRALAIDPSVAGAHSNRGTARRALGDLDGAIDDFGLAIALAPRDAISHYNRGNARHAKGDLAGAIADFDTALALDPGAAKTHVNRGIVHVRLKDLDRALADFERAIELDPRLPQGYANRGTVRERLGEHELALADYTSAIRLEPANAGSYIHRGVIRANMGDVVGARADLDQAIDLDPREASAHRHRGVVRRIQGDRAGARQDYDRAIALAPSDASAYYMRGNLRWEDSDSAGALADYSRAVECDPTLGPAWVNRGIVRLDSGDQRGALDDFDHAVAVAPSLGEARLARGELRARLGDIDGALDDLERATLCVPVSWKSWLAYGQVLAHVGKREAALAAFQKALALVPVAQRAKITAAIDRLGRGR